MRALAAVAVLLIGALAAPAQAQAPAANELVKDAEGDVGFRQIGNPGPATPLAPALDILSVRVHGEDHEGLWLELAVKQLKEAAPVPQPGGGNTYEVHFGLEQPAMGYRASFSIVQPYSNATPDYQVVFCAAPGRGYCVTQRADGHADYARNALVAYIPKLSLMGRNTVGDHYVSVEMPEVPLGIGSKLIDFRAESYGQYLLGDRAPNSGASGPYVMQSLTANHRIRLGLARLNETDASQGNGSPITQGTNEDRGAFPRVSVDASAPTSVRLELSNLNGAKRVANLTTQFVDAKSAEHWSLRLAPSLAVPGNESRTVNLILSAKTGVQHREEALVKVLARSIGFKDELGSLTLRLVASVSPSMERPVLYLHGAQGQYNAFQQAFCDGLRGFSYSCMDRLWLNTLENDPLSQGNPRPSQGYFSAGFQSSASYVFPLDAGLASDVVFNPKVPVVVRLAISSGAGGDGTVQARLFGGDHHIGTGSMAFKGGSSEPLEITFLPLLDATRVTAGSKIRLEVTLQTPYQNAGGLTAPPTIVLKESRITLPIIADPNATTQIPSKLGDAFISLNVKGDREEFVNPGEARGFQLTIVNEGALDDTVTMTSLVDGDGCRAEFRPGSKYRLEAGDSARFDMLVFAPSGAKEGGQCKVRINATSQIDPATMALRDVVVTITRGVDVPDDAQNWTSNSDAASKLAEKPPSKKSPGPSSLALGLVVLGLAGLGRRRSQI